MKNQPIESVTEIVASEPNHGPSSVGSVVVLALVLWLGLVTFLGSEGAFVAREGSPPLPIFVGIAIPLAVFFAAYFGWSAFRTFILGVDLRVVAAMQAWRWAGQHFFFLYAAGVLPALFTFPAAIGDMAVGFTAPWIVLGLVRNPLFSSSRRFMIWNILGITDFVVATSMAVLCSGLFHGITTFNGNVTTRPMAQLPLVYTPAYIVPFFIMLHCTAVFQTRHLARSRKLTSGLMAD